MNRLFTLEKCARCGTSLKNKAHIMSMFNEDILCMQCKEEEKKNVRYKEAVEADIEEIKKGNYNFKGIGL